METQAFTFSKGKHEPKPVLKACRFLAHPLQAWEQETAEQGLQGVSADWGVHLCLVLEKGRIF